MKVYFEFIGGPRDGEILEGDTEQGEPQDFDIDIATAYFWETEYGKIGSEFFVLSPFARKRFLARGRKESIPPEHKYRITRSWHEGNEVWVTAAYVAPVRPDDVSEDHKCPWYERLINLGIDEVVSVHPNFPNMD
jgi:hypothetical protein